MLSITGVVLFVRSCVYSLFIQNFKLVAECVGVVCGLLQESEASKNIEEASCSIEVKVLIIRSFIHSSIHPFISFVFQPGFGFVFHKLSEKVLDINDLSAVGPLEKDESKEEEQKGAESANRFVAVSYTLFCGKQLLCCVCLDNNSLEVFKFILEACMFPLAVRKWSIVKKFRCQGLK